MAETKVVSYDENGGPLTAKITFTSDGAAAVASSDIRQTDQLHNPIDPPLYQSEMGQPVTVALKGVGRNLDETHFRTYIRTSRLPINTDKIKTETDIEIFQDGKILPDTPVKLKIILKSDEIEKGRVQIIRLEAD